MIISNRDRQQVFIHVENCDFPLHYFSYVSEKQRERVIFSHHYTFIPLEECSKNIQIKRFFFRCSITVCQRKSNIDSFSFSSRYFSNDFSMIKRASYRKFRYTKHSSARIDECISVFVLLPKDKLFNQIKSVIVCICQRVQLHPRQTAVTRVASFDLFTALLIDAFSQRVTPTLLQKVNSFLYKCIFYQLYFSSLFCVHSLFDQLDEFNYVSLLWNFCESN